jgi:hypothetical protein
VENETTTCQKLQDTEKVVLWGKFVVMSAYKETQNDNRESSNKQPEDVPQPPRKIRTSHTSN